MSVAKKSIAFEIELEAKVPRTMPKMIAEKMYVPRKEV
jgi:hypothetical protein